MPASGGLYDLRLGPNDRSEICQTCGLGDMHCAGHSGHISLPVPVYNPVFFSHLYQLLRGSCFACKKLLAPPFAVHLTLYQLQALDYGLVSTVYDLAEMVNEDLNEQSSEEKLFALCQKLERKFQKARREAKADEYQVPVKSIVECRKYITRNFINKYMMNASSKCPHCKMPKKKLTRYGMRIIDKISPSVATASEVSDLPESKEFSQKELMPQEAKRHLLQLWENEENLLCHLYKALYSKESSDCHLIDMFFLDAILVPPSRFRRLNFLNGKKYADGQTLILNEILTDSLMMMKIIRKKDNFELSASDEDFLNKCQGKTLIEKFNYTYQKLQRHVTEMFDNDINKDKNKVSKGIKQILEKKEGLFRMNMMGKRVNYASRSVISPDPYIMVNEIGIPLVFAKKLTFPEPVNYHNVENLRRAVMNGPDIHPGASFIEMEDGRKVKLPANDIGKRLAIAKTLLTPQSSALMKIGGIKIVHRHIKNGDMVLLNRQPTLHRPSIMAHKAHILPGEKTLRLHYSNCKSYNADFDGDEMNCHLPQSYMGQGECHELASVNHQYLVPKDGTPLGGLIQDHIIAGVLLTTRGRFFTKDKYQQLIFSAMSFFRKKIKMLPPAILKPQVLWSGKQVVSTIIINLIPEGKIPPTLEGKAKVSRKNWKSHSPSDRSLSDTTDDCMTESEVIIRQGELLCGVIDKGQVGPTPYSVIHMCYELYGGEIANTILTAFARLFTHYLQYFSGFSLGVEDIFINKKANKERRRILRSAKSQGLVASARAFELDGPKNPDIEELLLNYKKAHRSRDDTGLKILDMEMKSITTKLNNEINKVCILKGLRKKFPLNNLQLMVESGAKGSSVNAMQISCLLGQIELEGRRMPLMLNGSTLPSFLPYTTSPQAGGFGLIDTAVKTSRSGYLQRCLIKHLEGISVNYDLTVRDSDGTVIQFLYGEDGMDPSKTQLLKGNHLHLLGMNYKAAMSEKNVKVLKNMTDVDLTEKKKELKKWLKKHPEKSKCRISPVASVDCKPNDLKARLYRVISKLNNMDEKEEKRFKKETEKCPDCVNSEHRPDITFGSVSEKMDSLISEYISKNPHQLLWDKKIPKNKGISKEKFQDLCHLHCIKSLAKPGDNVGLLAAQSIGEPSTQMTLNTFHFAGKGEMNVTLGIPRIREILMTASANIATPTMDLPFLDLPGIKEKAEKLKLKISPICMKDILDEVHVKEYLSVSVTRSRNYVIKMQFLKHSEYKNHANTTPTRILYYIEQVFIRRLIAALSKKMGLSSSSRRFTTKEKSESSKNELDAEKDTTPMTENVKDENESSEESEGEGDTTDANLKRQQEEEYQEPEEEEMLPDSENENEEEEESVKKEINSDNEDTDLQTIFTLPEMPKKLKKKVVTDYDKLRRINKVKAQHNWVSDYNFDTSSERWCEISIQLPLREHKVDMKTLLEEEINKANVHSIPNIKEAILVENPSAKNGCNMMLKINGVNFLEIFKYIDILDINKIYSNNIHEVAKIYGIEAAGQVIKKEIVNVFAAYGITVDPHHLSLISDYMTCSGEYRPCNRVGMEGNASPLQQITFETSKNFMTAAMCLGVEDRLKSPSANIFVGQMPQAGTGCFDLLSVSGDS
ncbi:DNA-directed RNA polymerase I subunit RPA1 [Trichonephila inaurata madagascariensis]|uniref:DNA-directed RNA polymerase subunit n=1 Tax=Trichonephila inaurata madagascariensis TaxID=2747483 RepID=A0A8X7BYE5_9ARAC|nr:DNA-directed RNA polymerase I subunit RPA1 [Trichonephila inaurata madagascariensis]